MDVQFTDYNALLLDNQPRPIDPVLAFNVRNLMADYRDIRLGDYEEKTDTARALIRDDIKADYQLILDQESAIVAAVSDRHQKSGEGTFTFSRSFARLLMLYHQQKERP